MEDVWEDVRHVEATSNNCSFAGVVGCYVETLKHVEWMFFLATAFIHCPEPPLAVHPLLGDRHFQFTAIFLGNARNHQPLLGHLGKILQRHHLSVNVLFTQPGALCLLALWYRADLGMFGTCLECAFHQMCLSKRVLFWATCSFIWIYVILLLYLFLNPYIFVKFIYSLCFFSTDRARPWVYFFFFAVDSVLYQLLDVSRKNQWIPEDKVKIPLARDEIRSRVYWNSIDSVLLLVQNNLYHNN